MTTETTVTTALTTIRQDLEKCMPKLAEVATKHCTPEKIVRIMLAACSRNPKLLECSRESVMLFCMKCSETGLAPIGPGGSWPVPYKNNKTNKVEMQFIPDYRGMVNCAKRAGCITDAYAEVVKENDEFEYTLGLTPSLEHKPAKSERGKMVNAYCVFSLPDGTKRFTLMDKEEIEGIRKRSKAATSGPWVTDESEMWKKTVVRRAMKPFAGMSAELDAALEADNAATGLVEREPIAMPKAKTIDAEVKENPPNEPEAGNTAGDDHTAIPPAQPSNESTIKADLIQAIKARRKADVLKFNTVCSELKIGSKEWENESVDSLVILNERLRGKKSA